MKYHSSRPLPFGGRLSSSNVWRSWTANGGRQLPRGANRRPPHRPLGWRTGRQWTARTYGYRCETLLSSFRRPSLSSRRPSLLSQHSSLPAGGPTGSVAASLVGNDHPGVGAEAYRTFPILDNRRQSFGGLFHSVPRESKLKFLKVVTRQTHRMCIINFFRKKPLLFYR